MREHVFGMSDERLWRARRTSMCLRCQATQHEQEQAAQSCFRDFGASLKFFVEAGEQATELLLHSRVENAIV